jgi:pyruvate/2-oxoglutarate dehydrogenase complex dihydrolipoamide dehydrogenase (E3) component
VAITPFAVAVRPIIDGRPTGFCKLIVDRATHQMIGCHVVGERAVELAQVASVAIAAEMTVELESRRTVKSRTLESSDRGAGAARGQVPRP